MAKFLSFSIFSQSGNSPCWLWEIYFVFPKIELQLTIGFSPLPTESGLYSACTSCLPELALTAAFGNVHKKPATEWKRGVGLTFEAFGGAYKPGGGDPQVRFFPVAYSGLPAEVLNAINRKHNTLIHSDILNCLSQSTSSPRYGGTASIP